MAERLRLDASVVSTTQIMGQSVYEVAYVATSGVNSSSSPASRMTRSHRTEPPSRVAASMVGYRAESFTLWLRRQIDMGR